MNERCEARAYGPPPPRVAMLHGGPGAPGELAPVARTIADEFGVLEPLQSGMTVRRQVRELLAGIVTYAQPPVTLVGWSWGAWLALLFASEYPALVRKVVLVGCPPLEESYAAGITRTRLAKLDPREREDVAACSRILVDPAVSRARAGDALARLGALYLRADVVAPLTLDTELLFADHEIYRAVWPEAAEMRRSGALLEAVSGVRCPVTALHGDSDAHPARGVSAPLSAVVDDFRLVTFEQCGHYPWLERNARGAFFHALRHELR